MRFFDEPNIPLMIKLTKRLNLKEAVYLLTTNKTLSAVYKNQDIWSQRFGARSFAAFHEITRQLREHYSLKEFIKAKYIREKDIADILDSFALSDEAKLQKLLKPNHYNTKQLRETWISLFNEYCILILHQKLMTPDEFLKFPSFEHPLALFSYNGFAALKEKLITVEQYTAIKNQAMLPVVLSDSSLKMLRLGLLTPEQMKKMSTFRHMVHTVSDDGMKALMSGSITAEEIIQAPTASDALALINSQVQKLTR